MHTVVVHVRMLISLHCLLFDQNMSGVSVSLGTKSIAFSLQEVHVYSVHRCLHTCM